MPALALVLLTTWVGEIPVLLDPEGARREAAQLAAAPASDVRARLSAAEVLLLARDPRGSRAIVEALPAVQDPRLGARAAALALDASVALGDDAAVERYARALEAHAGWSAHARRQVATNLALRDQRATAMFGSILFSLALAVMMIGGARELLRLRAPTLIILAVVVVATLATATISPVLARVVLLADLGVLALAHAALSTVRRVAPAPRGRVFLAMLVLAGTIGVILAITSPLPWAFILTQVG